MNREGAAVLTSTGNNTRLPSSSGIFLGGNHAAQAELTQRRAAKPAQAALYDEVLQVLDALGTKTRDLKNATAQNLADLYAEMNLKITYDVVEHAIDVSANLRRVWLSTVSEDGIAP